MGLTILFTHLKIILLQCFQFSATISSIQTHPKNQKEEKKDKNIDMVHTEARDRMMRDFFFWFKKLLSLFLVYFKIITLWAIFSAVENTSLFGNVVDDIHHLIKGLHWFDVCCIRSGGYRVAHGLAQHARNTLDEDFYWMEDSPPPAIEALYHNILSI